MFCWTEVGARHAGIVQSLIATLTLAGLDELRKPGNSQPVALDLYSKHAYLHRMCGTASR
jgi:hypothetical protein